MHRDRGRSARRTLLMTGLTFLLVSADGPARAQDSWGSPRPYKLPPSLLGYFKTRYVNVDDSLIASLQETPDGPRGDIFVSGSFRPAVDAEGKTPEERARKIARAFVDQEATLLDIPDPAEIREMPLTWRDDGTALVHYVRYVGEVQLSEWFLRVEVGADGAITRVHATLSPVSSDLYAALKRKTISKEEVKKILERDLAKPGSLAPVITEPSLGATWRPPFVIWGAGGSIGLKPA